MADVRVRFVGDLGNLKSFDQAIANSAASAKQSFDAANRALGESVGPLTGGKNSAGLMLQNSRLVVDSINNTFRQSTDIIRRYLSGYKDIVDKATGQVTGREPVFSEAYIGSINKATGNVQGYMSAIERLAPAEREINALYTAREETVAGLTGKLAEQERAADTARAAVQRLAEAYAPRFQEAQTGYNEFSPAAEKARTFQLQNTIDLLQRRLNRGPGNPLPVGYDPQTRRSILSEVPLTASERGPLEAQIAEAQNQITQSAAVFQENRGTYRDALTGIKQEFEEARAPLKAAEDAAVNDLKHTEEQLGRVAADTEKQIGAIRQKNKALFNDVDNQLQRTPPIPPQFQQLLGSSPQLLKALQRQGLGVNESGVRTQFGTPAFQETLAKQGIEIKTLVRDITKGETQLRLAYSNLGKGPGLLKAGYQEATVAIADNGNVITKWSGILSGSNNLITQFGRNIQRSFGYLVSGALTFGTIGIIFQAISNVNKIDANLQRLSITAQSTGRETQSLFSDLARVAIETATPIEEVVSAADDIALAVQRAGQSTEQYHKDIVSLTEAVGIFTNLTGTDTVAATDLLSSAFKQLGVGPEQLIGILSKITSVAGGQSKSIQDIAEGLGSIAAAGKAGSLSVNEMIGTLQVLSQVTAKSPAEVAVAFKNLIGSLASPGSKKILAQFDISTKDKDGAVRNIIEVYKEIADKAASGIIPSGRLQEVIRGISGGPRRAPDAAALLANINKVIQETGIAAAATNQALIANARVLDTNTAKITQFENALKIAFFEDFGPAIKDVIANLAQLGTALLGFTRLLPQGLLASGLQVIALLGSFTLLRKLIGTFALPLLGGLKNDLLAVAGAVTGTGLAFEKATVAEAEYVAVGNGRYRNTATGQFANTAVAEASIASSGRTGLLSKIPRVGKIGNIVGLAAIGATAVNYAGSSDTGTSDTVSQILTLGGTIASFIPQVRVLGIAATLAGVGISVLGGDAKKTSDDLAQNANAMYDALNAYKQAQSDVGTAKLTQKQLFGQIQSIESDPNGKKTIEQRQILTGLYQAYGDAASAVVVANEQMSKSFDDILKLQPALAEKFKSLDFLRQSGISISSDQINSYQQELTKFILTQSGQGFVNPDDILKNLQVPRGFVSPATTPGLSGLPESDRVLFKDNNTNSYSRGPKFSDLANAQGDDLKNTLTSVFANDAVFEPTKQNLQTIGEALTKVRDLVPIDTFNKWAGQFQKIAAQSSTLAAITQRANLIGAYLQAGQTVGKPSFTPENVEGAQKLINVTKELLSGAGNLPTGQTGNFWNGILDKILGPGKLQQGIKDLTARLKSEGGLQAGIGTVLDDLLKRSADSKTTTSGPTQQRLAELVNTYLNPLDLLGNVKSNISIPKDVAVELYKTQLGETNGQLELFNQFSKEGQDLLVAQFWKDKGIEVQGYANALGNTSDEAERLAKAEAHLEEVQKGLNSFTTEGAERQADLAKRIASGEFTSRPRYLKNLKDEYSAADSGAKALYKTLANLPADRLREFERQFTKIPGLEDAATLTAQQFVDKLYTQYVNLGLTGGAIDKATGKTLALAGAIAALPDSKVITVALNVVNTDLGVGAGIAAGVGGTTITDTNPGGAATGTKDTKLGGATPPVKPADPAKAAADAFAKAVKDALKGLLGGNASNINAKPPSASDAAKANLSYSQLEIADNIKKSEELKLTTRSADVKEIIRGAILLQSQIPGEKDRNKNERVAITDGLKVVANTSGISSELLRKSMDNLADIEKKRLDFDTKADQIRRIRVGSGDFAALANVPFNSTSGVSVGGPNSITININGAGLTPAQYAAFADKIASEIKRTIANG